MAQFPKERTVLFDHDGGADDLLSLIMLLAMPHINLAGIVTTPANCFLRPAASATRKILRFMGCNDIEVSNGTLHGVNPFPRVWRTDAYAIDAFPILNELKPVDSSQRPIDKESRSKGTPGPGRSDSIEYQIRGLSSVPHGRDSFKELKERLRDKLGAELDPEMEVSHPDELRPILEKMYEQVLAQENIILSRTERSRLFENILAEILDEPETGLPTPVSEPGNVFLARKLREANEPLTVLITGPVSNLAAALAVEPQLASKIEEVVWMGGALNVPGNVLDHEHDGSAEWNAYWDPPATYSLWQMSREVPITLFPLDATNHVPVTKNFLHRLAQQRKYPLSDLAGQCWALTVGTIPGEKYTYYMWDTLTTGYLGVPQYITFRQVRTKVIAEGPSAGRIKEVAEGGRLIQAADTVDVAGFQNYILELFRR